jgi:predicted dehydrogenase
MGEVAGVSCETQRRNPKVRAEDTATMLLRHESGVVSIVDVSYKAQSSTAPFPETLMEIEGDLGSIVVPPGCRARNTSWGLTWEEEIGAPLLPWTSRPWHVSQEGTFGACRHLLERVRAVQPAKTSDAGNLETLALVDAAYRAAALGQAVAPRRRHPRG